MRVHSSALLLALLMVVPSLAAPPSTLDVVDDRREPIEAPLEVCAVIALERTCSELVGGHLELPPNLDFMTIEGEEHGPVTLSRQDFQWEEEHSARAVVPRKAKLRFDGIPPSGVEMTLFRVDDPGFHRPIARKPIREGDTIRVPVGRHLLALTGKSFAPDLRELTLQPAEEVELKLRRRPGGSLILRVRARGDAAGEGALVEGAAVRLLTSSLLLAEGVEPRRLGEVSTSSSGLALFSGIEIPLVDAALAHPSLLPGTASALAIEPGTFAFREVVLDAGGTLVARVTLDDEVLPGAGCRLLLYDRTPSSDAPPKEVWSGVADPTGICRGDRLREGEYLLRVAAPSAAGRERRIDVPVRVTEGGFDEVDAALERVLLEGTIVRGEEPAPGFRVVVHDLEAPKPYARDADAAAAEEADEEGYYRVTLWRPGEYRLHVQNPRGPSALIERMELHAGSQVRDFELGPYDIEGRVVDSSHEPIPGAAVSLTWRETDHHMGFTDEEGRFAFSLVEDAGTARLRARSKGFFPSDPLEIEVSSGRPPLPVEIVLQSDGGIDGRLVGPSGPVAGGTVIAYQEEFFPSPRWLGQVTTDAEGSFRIPRAASGPTRVFYTGPGCPLGSRRAEAGFPDGGGTWRIPCGPASGGVEVILRNPDLSPRSGSGVLLRRGGLIFPREVVAAHLTRARLPFVSDANGRLLLAGLEPGVYDLYLAEATSPAALRMGLERGFLATVQLAPSTTRSLEVVLEEPIPDEAP